MVVQRMIKGISDDDYIKVGDNLYDYFDDTLFQSYKEPPTEKQETEECDLRNFKRIAADNDEEIGSKRIKLCSQLETQGEELNSGVEKGTTLSLKLKKTPSLKNLVKMKLPKAKYNSNNRNCPKNLNEFVSRQQHSGHEKKLKASNFGASKLKIGSWERISWREGDLVAKCYYAKRKFVWEILDGALKSKIEMQWSDIVGIRATIDENELGVLEIELKQPPLFFQEINPQPKKHTLWEQASDFTDGQAPICRIHTAIFPPGILYKHYEKILQSDKRFFDLSKKPFPTVKFPYFDHHNTEFSFDFGCRSRPELSWRYPVPNFLISPPSHHNQYLPNIIPTRSVIDFTRIDERGSNPTFENQTTTFASQELPIMDKAGDRNTLASQIPYSDYVNNDIEQNYLIADSELLEANPPSNYDNDYYGMFIQQLQENPSNYYDGTNTTHSYGVPEYANPVSWFQPQDSDDNNTMMNIQNEEWYRDFLDTEIPHWDERI